MSATHTATLTRNGRTWEAYRGDADTAADVASTWEGSGYLVAVVALASVPAPVVHQTTVTADSITCTCGDGVSLIPGWGGPTYPQDLAWLHRRTGSPMAELG
jgi:hypothetical protein